MLRPRFPDVNVVCGMARLGCTKLLMVLSSCGSGIFVGGEI